MTSAPISRRLSSQTNSNDNDDSDADDDLDVVSNPADVSGLSVGGGDSVGSPPPPLSPPVTSTPSATNGKFNLKITCSHLSLG